MSPPSHCRSAGQLQLNVMEPVITFALFTSIATMENAVNRLHVTGIDGITANVARATSWSGKEAPDAGEMG